MKNILVLCTGNSCRSQMAHAYLQLFAGKRAVVYSAGVEVHGVNPKAVETLKEDGVDISSHTSNHVDEYAAIPFDFVITVCDNARERCPYFPSTALRFHHNFSDPSKLKGSTEEVNWAFRKTREEIKAWCKEWVANNL